MSRALLRSVLELRTPITRLPPPFLLPIRTATPSIAARFIHQTAQIIEPVSQHSDIAVPAAPSSSSTSSSSIPSSASTQSSTSTTSTTTTTTGSLDESVKTLLPLLAAQPGGHYVTIHIHGRPYLVTAGDSIRLPFRMPGVAPGDVLRLNRASVLGSRDYTLKGAPYVDERLYECRAVVLGTEAEPMRIMIKKKQRNRRKKHVRSKHKYTILRISEVKVCSDAEIEG
ncbi:ribosomal protein L21-like protein [Diplogelasinospora grovesii]|uniref:Large ribosomal subunit protein bL21m n=1 Tax=Diplogelasinospora grovesii TaxID=303347 RepID=A0AAN6S0Q3_9PEZI|nr:ribosomal protein L21-like protein [Diplogelasinospora grovesii]